MASQISIQNIYSGQMVWALCAKHPYWPSIVYPSNSQKIVKGDHPNKSVHVRFFASGWNGRWVKLENVFEFNGHESFRAMKRSMKSTLSEDDFNKAFETENDEKWHKAVSEATFVLNSDSRLIIFDTLYKSMIELRSRSVAKSPTHHLVPVVLLEQIKKATQSKVSNELVHRRRNSEAPLVTDQSEQCMPGYSVRMQAKFDEFLKDSSTYRVESHPKNILFENTPHNDRNDADSVKSAQICSNKDKIPETEPSRRSSYKKRMEQQPLCNEWKQAELSDLNSKCPLRVCHTCYSIERDVTKMTTEFTYCVKCTTTYHVDSCCIPAETIILTRKQHICIGHRCEAVKKLPSLDWCFRCGDEGGILVCCNSCPKTYHNSCLRSSEFRDSFLYCLSGRNPMYGENVLVKYGEDPWWPSVIVPSFKIPIDMYDDQPNDDEFCVRFFYQGYQFGWIGRDSVCLYSKNEAKSLIGNSKRDEAFIESAIWFDKIDDSSNNSNDKNNNEIISQEEQAININEIITLETNAKQLSQQPPKYIKITTNTQVAPAKLTKSKVVVEPFPCSCRPDDDDPCGPTSNCENHQLYIECDAKHCSSGVNCKNQCFARKLSAAVKVVFINDKKGFGVVADQFIYAGSLVKEYVGELINENEFQRRRKCIKTQSIHHYVMTYSKGLYIDSGKKGNESRFINHSCEPNCEIQKWCVKNVNRIGFFAKMDIAEGTEITANYGFSAAGDIQQKCFCGVKKCKGVIE